MRRTAKARRTKLRARTKARRATSDSRAFRIEPLEHRRLLAGDLYISEFMASNDDSFEDAFGDSSDWIEILNAGSTTIDLTGMSLTDDATELNKWHFPSGSLAPGQSLVVAASGRDTVAPGGELHTNFKLTSSGEYLALVDIDEATIIHEYAPTFPVQYEDYSYGLAMEPTGSTTTLLAGENAMRYLVPNSSSLGDTWTELGFNDGTWATGDLPLGYDSSNGAYANLIETTVPSGTRSTFVRIPFNVSDLGSLGELTLDVKYDDGFVAYINGQMVAEDNAPNNPVWNSFASGIHNDNEAVIYQTFDASDGIPHLVQGENVLAIQLLNVSTTSSDYLIDARLTGTGTTLVMPLQTGYLDTATPGLANTGTFSGFVEDVDFSVEHGFYDSMFTLALSTPTPGAIVVYTTDGSDPAMNSNFNVTNGMIYSNPLTINQTSNIKAAAFKPDHFPTIPKAHTYVFLDDVINRRPTARCLLGLRPMVRTDAISITASIRTSSIFTVPRRSKTRWLPSRRFPLPSIPTTSSIPAAAST